MDIIQIKSKNQEELQLKIKELITLDKDETTVVTEIKRPFKFLFFSIPGLYEVKIVKKSEIKKEKVKQEKKEVKKNVKKEEIKVNQKVSEKTNDKYIEKLNALVKEFIVLSELKIEIKEIKLKNSVYNIELDGEDIKYIIGEKGKALTALEEIISSIDEFKEIRISFDSNNYKEKRKKILKDLANKTAKTVLKTKKSIKLNPMPAKERKIIHEQISKIDHLETISVGVDPKRSLIIKYKK